MAAFGLAAIGPEILIANPVMHDALAIAAPARRSADRNTV
jgi:hypothetical protein